MIHYLQETTHIYADDPPTTRKVIAYNVYRDTKPKAVLWAFERAQSEGVPVHVIDGYNAMIDGAAMAEYEPFKSEV